MTSKHTTACSKYDDLASVSGLNRVSFASDSPIERETIIVPLIAEWIHSAALYKAGSNTRGELEREMASFVKERSYEIGY